MISNYDVYILSMEVSTILTIETSMVLINSIDIYILYTNTNHSIANKNNKYSNNQYTIQTIQLNSIPPQ